MTLETSKKGLLLKSLVTTPQLGMYDKFNNRIFGTKNNNPILDAISEEMHQHFINDPDNYQLRPIPETQLKKFNQYLLDAVYIYGPDALNAVIERQLFTLQQLQEAISFISTKLKMSVSDTKKYQLQQKRGSLFRGQFKLVQNIADMAEAPKKFFTHIITVVQHSGRQIFQNPGSIFSISPGVFRHRKKDQGD